MLSELIDNQIDYEVNRYENLRISTASFTQGDKKALPKNRECYAPNPV